MAGFLIVNPRSGDGRPSADELRREAEARGIAVHVLRESDDAASLIRAADADALGAAGGDGSLAAVAEVAIERDLPFVCIPFGTRNHFARDLGLDRDDPIGALAAFAGSERRIDVARADDAVFLNNVSFGAYASLVHDERRLGRLVALWRLVPRRPRTSLRIDGAPVRARMVFIGNNTCRLDPLRFGERDRLDEGLLQLGIARGWLPHTWTESRGQSFAVDAAGEHVEAAIDGEPVRLSLPLEVRIEPQALRVLVPAVQP